ncbi:cytochrome C [Aliarcobacter lanthieri]|uniref:cytochrome C n=1 Tax=Aliarcobacter lanthieri TaxID=1355374 RepID=UPI003AA8BDEE
MKLLKILAVSSLILGLSSTSLFADSAKGQKAFIKFLKEPCGMDGAKFALKHTQEEWRKIKADGKGEAEIIKICPNVKAGDVKESLIEHIMDFSIEFAKDSGNVPSC